MAATDVIDTDEATPDNHWADTDPLPVVSYYEVTAYDPRYPAAGPR